MKKFLLPLILGVSLTGARAQLIFEDFNSNASSFTSQFTVQASGSADGFQWSATAGVANVSPGRVDSLGAGNHTDAVYYNTGVTWSTGVTYEASIFFLQSTVTDGHIYQAMSGFLRSTGSNFAGGGSAVWGQLRDPGNGNPFLRLFVQSTQVGSNSATFSLTSNTWYELATRMTLSSATLGDIGVYLFSRGSDGTAARSLVQSIELTGQTITNGGFSSTQFWATFGGGNNSGSNIAAFDNFTVIPEPSTWALLAGGLSVLTIFRRRKQA